MPQLHDPFMAMMEDDSETEMIDAFYVDETGYALLPMSEKWIRQQQQIPDQDIVSSEVENVVEFRVTEISHGDIFISYDDGDGIRLTPYTVDELTDRICDA